MSDGTTLAAPNEDSFELTDPDLMQESMERWAATRSKMMTFIGDHLKGGVDYMTIHRKHCRHKDDKTMNLCGECGGKATLCKPGAEKIATSGGLLRLTPTFERDDATWEMLGKRPGYLCYVCRLVTADGRVVAEGRGARRVNQDEGDVNKTVKMAQKSAHIDATLRCAGLSEIFTQDMEDLAPAERRIAEAASEDAPPAPRQAPVPHPAPSPAPRPEAQEQRVRADPNERWGGSPSSRQAPAMSENTALSKDPVLKKECMDARWKLIQEAGVQTPSRQYGRTEWGWYRDPKADCGPEEHFQRLQEAATGQRDDGWVKTRGDAFNYLRMVKEFLDRDAPQEPPVPEAQGDEEMFHEFPEDQIPF